MFDQFRIDLRQEHKSLVAAAGLAVLYAISSGCDLGETDKHGAPKPSLDEDEYPEELCGEIAAVMCYNIFECCTGKQIEDAFGIQQSATESDCRRDLELLCKDDPFMALLLRSLGPEVETVELDLPGVEQCLETLVAGDEGCFPFVMGEAAFAERCKPELIVAKQIEGHDCLADFECKGDAYCGADRKCKRIPDEGEPCTDRCAKDLYCGLDDQGERICRTFRQSGQSCHEGYSSLGEPPEYCEEDLYCELEGEEQEGVCRKKKEVGASCSDLQPCLTGDCLPGICGDGSECFKDDDCLGVCSGTDDACSDDSDCGGHCDTASQNSCGRDEDCGGVCRLSQTSCDAEWDCHVSGTCDVSGLACYGEFYCGSGTGTCSSSAISCSSHAQCDPGERCVPDEECVPGDNDECVLDSCVFETCLGRSTCQDRVCADPWAFLDFCELGMGVVDLVFGGGPDNLPPAEQPGI